MSEILKGLSWEKYLELDALNWSRLKVMAKSPAHYQWALTGDEKDTNALKFGRAGHTAILEPKLFSQRYAIWNARRSGKDWEAFAATCKDNGLEVLKGEQENSIRELSYAARKSPEASKLLTGGKSEVTVRWEVEVPHVGDLPGRKWTAKSRIDYLGKSIVDLKIMRSSKPDDFARAAWDLGYLGQAAFYSDAVTAATGEVLPFFFLVVEKTAPYVVTPFAVPDELLEVGREHYKGLLARLSICERTGVWPGYVEGVATLEIPRWAQQSEDEDVSDIGLTFESEAE